MIEKILKNILAFIFYCMAFYLMDRGIIIGVCIALLFYVGEKLQNE